jgi:hypothetical protein
MDKSALKQLVKNEYSNILPIVQRIDQAKRNLNEAKINEYYTASKYDPAFKVKKPWSGAAKQAEDVLKQLGAKPFALGLNPHGYELDVAKDRLWFYQNNEVWSTNQTKDLGYTIVNGTIQLWNAPGGQDSKSGFKVGVIKNQNGKPVFIEDTANVQKKQTDKPKKEKKLTKSDNWIDTFQTVLDYAGMIPVIGDAIDVLNAVIYFMRGKWFDGLLSCIAIIPIVGTGIKLSVKAIYKGAKLEKLVSLISKTFKKPATAGELWVELARNGAITPKQFRQIGTGLDSLSELLKSSYSGIRKIPGVDSAAILRQLDNFNAWMRNSSRTMDDLADAVKRGDKAPWLRKAAKETQSTGLKKIGNALSLKALPKLKRLPFFKPEKIAKIAAGLERRFVREMADPTKLTALIKTAPGRSKLVSSITSQANRRIAELPAATQRLIQQDLANIGYRASAGDSRNMERLLRVLQSNPATKGAFESITDTVTKHSIDNGSMLWTTFKNNDLNNLKTLMSKDMIPGGGAWYKEFDVSLRKNADVIWNEVHDAFEDLGLEVRPGEMSLDAKQDEVDGVIWPILKNSVAELTPGVYDAGNAAGNLIKTAANSTFAKSLADYATNKSQDAYKPGEEAGGKYK